MFQSLKNILHLLTALFALLWYRFPSNELEVIGVTGTDGKTTTVSLIYHILKTSGKTVSMVSSVGVYIGDKYYDVGFHVTNPASWPLQRFMRKSADLGKYLVLEVTSHGLDQYRVFGINFKIGVITNVTEEHLDYHKTYQQYLRTKARLLNMSETAVINRDDQSYVLLQSRFSQKKRLITYGLNKNADVNPKKFNFKTSLIGDFNKSNILAAVAVCRSLGVNDDQIREAIKTFKAPIGREEVVYKNDFTVMIDFAHTPFAFEQILKTVKRKVKGRLIHVFGSAGQRDVSKRPKMGEISARYADILILTSEDPRNESAEKIMDDITIGIKRNKFDISNCKRIIDRKMAIREAIRIAQKGDFILLTGKGHEKSMNYGNGEKQWSEHEAVKDALMSRAKKI